jgi:hypothetical protein
MHISFDIKSPEIDSKSVHKKDKMSIKTQINLHNFLQKLDKYSPTFKNILFNDL